VNEYINNDFFSVNIFLQAPLINLWYNSNAAASKAGTPGSTPGGDKAVQFFPLSFCDSHPYLNSNDKE